MPLHQLRWKLTLSYTGVTVGALLVVELLIIAGLLALFFQRLDVLAGPMINAAREDYAPSVRRHLEKSPPDQDGIADWLRRFETESTTIPVMGVFPIIFETNELDVLVIGQDGELLGSTPDSPEITPGMPGPLEAAQAGVTDTDRLYQVNEDKHQLVMAVPVLDEDEAQVVGVLVIIAPIPSTTEVFGAVAQLVGISLLCFTLPAGVIGTVFGFLSARGLVRRLDRLEEATLAWSQGDFSEFVDDLSGDEVGQLARGLNHMAQDLQNLLDARSELVILEERNRLARDLHDSTKQQAFALAAQISAGRRLLETDRAKAATYIQEAEQLAFSLRQELTALIQELRPAALEGQGLVVALREYGKDWSRQNDIGLDVRIQGERSLPLAIEQALFRLVQGALSNVARHSKATTAEIRLNYTPTSITCIISDNGVGFSPAKLSSGFGLRTMDERVALLNGTMTIESSVGSGTQIVIILPVNEEKTDG